MEPNAIPGFQRARGIGQMFQVNVEHVRRFQFTTMTDDVSSEHFVAFETLEIHGGSEAGSRFFHGLPMNLQAPNARLKSLGINFNLLSYSHTPTEQGSRNHNPEATHCENAVNRNSKDTCFTFGGCLIGDFVQYFFEIFQTITGLSRNRHNWFFFQESIFYEVLYVVSDKFDPFRFDQICFGENNEPCFYAEKSANRQMLPRLRHDAFIGGNNQHDQIDAADSRQHIFYESLMAWNVHDSCVDIIENQLGKPEFDGDAALFFFFEAVGICACQCFDERGFAMIDVAGGSDNNMFHKVISPSWLIGE